MKVGDLVRVGANFITENGAGTVSIVLEINEGDHPNRLQLVKIIEDGQPIWYPSGYIEVINEQEEL